MSENRVEFNFVEFLPQDATEAIFYELSGKDLISATMVKSDWNEFIGSTQKLMSKIKFAISSEKVDPDEPEEVVEILSKSNRLYDNLKIIRDRQNIGNLFDIIEPREWKHFQYHLKRNRGDETELMEKLTKHCQSLISLKLHLNRLEDATELLRNNTETLKILQLSGHFEKYLFLRKLVDLRLETLKINCTLKGSQHRRDSAQFLLDFLQSQSQTLKTLKFLYSGSPPFLLQKPFHIIFEMPKLKILTLQMRSILLNSLEVPLLFPENHTIPTAGS